MQRERKREAGSRKGDHFEDVPTGKQEDGDGIMESMCNSNQQSKPMTKQDKETN